GRWILRKAVVVLLAPVSQRIPDSIRVGYRGPAAHGAGGKDPGECSQETNRRYRLPVNVDTAANVPWVTPSRPDVTGNGRAGGTARADHQGTSEANHSSRF